MTNTRLPNLCKQIGNNWNLSAHQFRRTFANYAVHSELGDLRALKDHFKHWSITMTTLYAFNDDLDAELFEEEIKQDWFELDMPITGGEMTQNIKKVREDKELIKSFGSLSAMAEAYSSSIPIRSTGIGWCTNDDECKCGKPDRCESNIVDKRHQPYWEGMLVQQMKLMQLDYIGEAGRAVVKKDIKRCEKVLAALWIDVKAMKQEINERAYRGEKCLTRKKKRHTKRVRLAIVRIEKGRPNIVSDKRKMSIAAVAEEAGVSRALIHRDCPDRLERIKDGVNKGIRQQRDAKQTKLNEYKDRNRQLRSEVVELKAMLAKVQSQNATLIRKNMALSHAHADSSNVTQLTYS